MTDKRKKPADRDIQRDDGFLDESSRPSHIRKINNESNEPSDDQDFGRTTQRIKDRNDK